jgi:hypothetical protein
MNSLLRERERQTDRRTEMTKKHDLIEKELLEIS